jgi:hypothetical protein
MNQNLVILTPQDFDRFVSEMKLHLTKEVETIRGVVVEKPMCVKEAAAYLRIAERTLFKWLKDGTLPNSCKHEINNTTYFFPSELKEFIKKS